MTEEAEISAKITKLKKENKDLQSLLENAEQEMKAIVHQSQEESKQLHKVLQTVWPKVQNKLKRSTTPNVNLIEKASKAIQTENPDD